jgi:aspartate aminotransferase
LKGLAEWIWATLTAAGVTVAKPDGAFYMFPDFEPLRAALRSKGISSGEDLCQKLLDETGVAILPGSSFGRPESELTARMAFVDFDGARALAAVEQMSGDQQIDEAFLREYCGKVMTSIDLLTDWLKADS